MKKTLCIALSLFLIVTMVCPVTAVDYSAPFGAEYTQTVDSAFTFAFVGDTQKVAYFAPEKMPVIYDWLVEIAQEKNLKYVAGLGDITDKSQAFEWDAAISAIKKLDGVVPYSLVRGNHDDIFSFYKRVGYESYIKQLSGMYKNVLNSYQLVSVGTLNYLFLNLDHGPSDDVLAWAGEIIEKYPKHNVIITTHGYIDGSGQLLTVDNCTIPPSTTTGVNDGPAIWDGLVKKYENIVMVVCGHIGSRPKVANFEVVGDHGNKIQHVLVDPQRIDLNVEPSGIVALFHFSADGKTVQVENYATIQKTHYGPGIVFELNSMGGNANEVPDENVNEVPGENVDKAPGENTDAIPVNWPLLIGCGTGVIAVCLVVLFLLRKKKSRKTDNP